MKEKFGTYFKTSYLCIRKKIRKYWSKSKKDFFLICFSRLVFK